ncbi:phthalate transporter [Exophiala viscosa]|uniref:phthalate transporter n=1 Tax=Exophiala viscosa TaxID=2486360 RepID=UPI00219DE4F7|nr:phthalate transporter [Exophiala viscosa]
MDNKTVLESFPSSLEGGNSGLRNRRQPKKWWQFGGRDVSYVSVDDGIVDQKSSETSSLSDTGKNVNNVFVSPEALEIYKPVEGFEGTHRFNPTATWTPQEEKTLVRPCVMFFALQLDRGNITQALSDNMLVDLGMVTNDYNNGMTVFYCAFLLAELPSQLISKRLGPDIWIPIQMVSWSIVAASQAALSGKTSWYICRALLGLIEGGFIPDTILYLSYFYKNAELPKRLSWFWTSYQSTQIIGAFLAYGILHLRGRGGLGAGWRYLFVIEGCITGLIGIFTWLYLPASPTQTARHGFKGLLRPKNGWFTEREEVIMVTRVLRDDPNKATMHNRQGLSFKFLWEALTDYDMWPIYILGLSWTIPTTPPQAYITLTCKALGFDTFQTNLLTIPAYVLFILQLLFWTWASEKMNQRLIVGLIAQIWALPLLVALVALPPHFNNSNWAKWTLSTLLVGYPYAHAILVAMTSRNAGSVRTRTVGSSLYNMAVQASNVFSSQVYRTDDKPYYYRGNKALLGVVAWNIIAFCISKWYYVRKNNQRDRIWNAMTREERVQYLATTEDKGNKRLDFRFAS